jgi:hypothetical protein
MKAIMVETAVDLRLGKISRRLAVVRKLPNRQKTASIERGLGQPVSGSLPVNSLT